MSLIIIALAPVMVVAFYIYLRDRYEREPISQLLLAFAGGCLITLPVSYMEGWLSVPAQSMQGYASAGWTAFVVAAFTEEVFKFLALIGLFWNNRNFNEKFDGIVYAVYISLGFAAVENILYVMDGGTQVGILRAFTAVPAHALFGIVMGYQAGLARFFPQEKIRRLFFALAMPILLHGIYDFILMTEHPLLLLVFIPFMVFLWIFGFRRMKQLSDRSVFRVFSSKR